MEWNNLNILCVIVKTSKQNERQGGIYRVNLKIAIPFGMKYHFEDCMAQWKFSIQFYKTKALCESRNPKHQPQG